MLFDNFCLCVTNRFVFVLVDKNFSCFCVLCRCVVILLCCVVISVFLCVVLMLVKPAPVVLLIVNCCVVDVFARSNLADFLFVYVFFMVFMLSDVLNLNVIYYVYFIAFTI